MNVKDLGEVLAAGESTHLFGEIASVDFLGFEFNGRRYADQLAKTQQSGPVRCAVDVEIRELGGLTMVWIAHDFSFLGGSLGCAEGEKVVLGLEYAKRSGLSTVIVCQSGGARMQEGTMALMQMAKVSVAMAALKRAGLPVVTVCKDPCYGGVSASYAMQGDIRIGYSGARIGFAGPSVILNTIYQMNRDKYDREAPAAFQTAEYLIRHGQLDFIVKDDAELARVLPVVLGILRGGAGKPPHPGPPAVMSAPPTPPPPPLHTAARAPDRYACEQIVSAVFRDYVQLEGDGITATDKCLKGGLARLAGRYPCVVLSTRKGAENNYGMASPPGYRLAKRLMQLAERFGLPVFTLVDTVGAYPSFESESQGQAEAIASGLLCMAMLRVPIISLVVGEGGSGGALAIAMGNRVGMMSSAYYSVISPEGAASVLGRYRDEAHKAAQFGADARNLAEMQGIYAPKLLSLGVIDFIVPDRATREETLAEIECAFLREHAAVAHLLGEDLVNHRHAKFRRMGRFEVIREKPASSAAVRRPAVAIAPRDAANDEATSRLSPALMKLVRFIAEKTINSAWSRYAGCAPRGMVEALPQIAAVAAAGSGAASPNLRALLLREGPEAVAAYARDATRLLITDTTMRDAQQSLISTRLRTVDMLGAVAATREAYREAFSLEVWGGATFDAALRFLREDPWDRLRALRNAFPESLLQMLIRGQNGLGYRRYPAALIARFIAMAAEAGVDVFRIFDCFNSTREMAACIAAVRAAGRVAQVCICFTGDFLDPHETVYTLDYYAGLAAEIREAGAHMLCVKDMAGLLRAPMAAPLMATIRAAAPDLPVAFHTHNTSAAGLASALAMAHAGAAIVDVAVSAMADLTSQVSANALAASLQEDRRGPVLDLRCLDGLERYWVAVRTLYQPFECGLKAGSSGVYRHQIPGGQYSNLYAQCVSLGIADRWTDLVETYREVNGAFGDLIKVTPSSKCVGDMALFLVRNDLRVRDVFGDPDSGAPPPVTSIFPASVVALFAGELGCPHRGFPEHVAKIVLRGALPPHDVRVDARGERRVFVHKPPCPDVSWDDAVASLGTKTHVATAVPPRDTDVMTSVIYPIEYNELLAFRACYGDLPQRLPTLAYFYGMVVGQQIRLGPPMIATAATQDDEDDPVEITLKRVTSVDIRNERTLNFEVRTAGGQGGVARVSMAIKEGRRAETSGGPDEGGLGLADPNNPEHVASSLPGTTQRISATQGQRVQEGDHLMDVSAMKIDVEIIAPFAGTIAAICRAGAAVKIGSLLATIKRDVVA